MNNKFEIGDEVKLLPVIGKIQHLDRTTEETYCTIRTESGDLFFSKLKFLKKVSRKCLIKKVR